MTEAVGGSVGALAEQAIEKAKAGVKERKGRVDGGQEVVLKMDPIREKMQYLVTLHYAARDASRDLSSAITEVAKESGFNANALRQLVSARAGDFMAKRKQVQQLALLFEDEKPS